MRKLATSCLPTSTAALAAVTLGSSYRWQSAFGRSRFGAPGSSGRQGDISSSVGSRGASAAAASKPLPPRVSLFAKDKEGPETVFRANSTNDDELSYATRAAMRDDAIILSALFRHIPNGGAISVKSLASQLSADVQEALSEKHGGLSAFLEERKQFFVVKPRPEDGVLFVATNPIAAQKFAVRELQQNTMRQMLGLPEEGEDIRMPRGGRGGRGGSFRRGGDSAARRGPGQSYGGSQRDHDAGRDAGRGRRGPGGQYQQQQQRGSGGPGFGGGKSGRGSSSSGFGRASGSAGRSSGSGGSSSRSRDGPMGGREQSFGSRSSRNERG